MPMPFDPSTAGADPIAELLSLVTANGGNGAVAPPRTVTPPPMPQPQTSAPAKHGLDWRKLIELAAPAIGGVASGNAGNSAAFMHAYQQEQVRHQQEQQRQQQTTQQQNRLGADYLLKIGEHAQSYDDPVALDEFLRLAEDAGTKAGYVKPGEVRGKFTVPASKINQKRLKQVSDQLDALEKGGYNLDELAQAGSAIEMPDGTRVPVSSALDLTRKRPMDASGTPIAKPDKADVSASTDYGRFLARYAKGKGKTVDALTAADELDARKQYGQADDKTPTATGPTDYTSRYLNNLVSLWKESHPGQEPPASVTAQLMRKAKDDLRDQGTGATGVAPGSGLSEDGLDYAATQYRVTGVMPPMGMGKTPDRARIINRTAEQAKLLGQTPAAAIQKQAAYKSDGAALTKMQQASAAAESFETKATAQADIVRELSRKVDRTQWPLINQAILSGQINLLGDTNAQLLANAVQTFSTEYAKIIEGATGSAAGSSDSARSASQRLISAAMNKKTVAGVLDLMEREMALTVQGYGATIEHITQRMGGVPPATTATTPAPSTNPGSLSYDDYLRAKGKR
jgi:hypothetical protein